MIVPILSYFNCLVESYPNVTQPELPDMFNRVKNGSFTELYPQSIISIYGFYDTTRLAESIPGHKEVFEEFGLYQYSRDIRHILLRLLIQPCNEISSIIRNFLQDHDMSDSISIQIRMGGKYAASNERATFMDETTMTNYLNKINNQHSDKHFVYLSTDSPSIIPTIKSCLRNLTVIQDTSFQVGHSRKTRRIDNYFEGFKRAIVDAILASHGTTIYITGWSTYGTLIRYLSFNTHTITFLWKH